MPLPWQTAASGSINSPRSLPNLAAWYDASDLSAFLNNAGATPASGDGIKLWADKSGNSGVNCLCFDGSNSNFASTPDAAPLRIVGDIDLRAKLGAVAWTAASFQTVIDKRDSDTKISYELSLDNSSSGKVVLYTSPDGTSGAAILTRSTASVPFTAYQQGWVRATLQVNNGSGGNTVNFYTSTDGVNWVALGAPVINAGTTSIFNSTSSVGIGSAKLGTIQPFTGRIYRVQVLNGIAGTVVFDADFSKPAKLAATFAESSVNAATVTINTAGDTGARICGERDLYQGALTKQPIYLPWTGSHYGYLRGANGDYFSSPNSAATRITGDIDLRVMASLVNWAPAANNTFIGKDDTGANRDYLLYTSNASDGKLIFFYTPDGTTIRLATSTAGTGFAANSTNWVRATYATASGNVNFYTSADGTSWTPLGTTVVIASGSIHSGSSNVSVGSDNGTASPLTGRIYRAQILNGIAGTVAFDFDASRYVSGTTFVEGSVNAAVVTLNAGATIVTRACVYADGVDDYLKAAAFALSQPATVYLSGQQIAWVSNASIFDGNATDGMRLVQKAGGASPQIVQTGSGVNDNNWVASTHAIVCSVWNGALSLIRVNRKASTAGPATTVGTPNGFMLGSDGAGTARWSNILASEAAIYAAAHDLRTQDRFALYAGKKNKVVV